MFFYREIPEIPEKPLDQARYIFDASNTSSITLATLSGIPNRVVSWTSTGANTSSAVENSTTAPFYDASSNSIRFFSGSNTRYNLTMSPATSNPNLSTPTWHMFAVINPVDITRNQSLTAAYNNHQIFAFAQYGGLYIALSGSTRVAQAHIYDGAHRGVATGSLNLNEKVLIEGKATGTAIAVAVNGGNFVSASAGSTISSNGWPTQIAGNWSTGTLYGMSGSIHEIVVFSSSLADDRRTLWTDYLKAKWNV
jgi:hypothetical protein